MMACARISRIVISDPDVQLDSHQAGHTSDVPDRDAQQADTDTAALRDAFELEKHR